MSYIKTALSSSHSDPSSSIKVPLYDPYSYIPTITRIVESFITNDRSVIIMIRFILENVKLFIASNSIRGVVTSGVSDLSLDSLIPLRISAAETGRASRVFIGRPKGRNKYKFIVSIGTLLNALYISEHTLKTSYRESDDIRIEDFENAVKLLMEAIEAIEKELIEIEGSMTEDEHIDGIKTGPLKCGRCSNDMLFLTTKETIDYISSESWCEFCDFKNSAFNWNVPFHF